MKPLLTIALLLICSTVAANDLVLRGVTPGTYVLTVGADGTVRLTVATVVTPTGTPTTPTTPTGSGVRAVSAAAYNEIDKAVSESHRLPLAEKFQALAFGLVTKRRISGKPFIALEDAAAAEAAIVADEVGDDLPKFKDWQNAYRKEINATKPVTAEDLANQYDQVSLSLAATAIDIEKLMKLLKFIMKLIALFGGL